MTSVTGILASLALVLAIATLLIAAVLHRKRAMEEAGYRRVDTADDRIADAARAVSGCEPLEAYARDEHGGESWLLFLRTSGNGRPDCGMLIRSFANEDWPNLALVKEADKGSKTGRGNGHDFTAGMQPVDLAELSGGWRVYQEAGHDLSAPLASWLSKLIQQDGLNRLHGIALRGPYLMAWTSPRRINALISAGAKLSARVTEARRD